MTAHTPAPHVRTTKYLKNIKTPIGLYTHIPLENDLLRAYLPDTCLSYPSEYALEQAFKEKKILLSIKVLEHDVVCTSEDGHYKEKRPFLLLRLLENIATLLKDLKQNHQLGVYTFCTKDRTLKGPGHHVLTSKEAELLEVLIERSPQEVSRADLLKKIWKYTNAMATRTLETHVYNLRQKIETTPSAPKIIVSTESGYAIRIVKPLKAG